MTAGQNPAQASQSYQPRGDGVEDSYRVAYDESVRAIDILDSAIERTRTRYVGLLGVLGASSAFLAGSVVKDVERSPQFYVFSGLATACFLAAVATALYDLWPRARGAGIRALDVIEYFIEQDISLKPGPILAKLTQENSDTADRLQQMQSGMARRFSVFLFLFAASLSLWISVAWMVERIPSL